MPINKIKQPTSGFVLKFWKILFARRRNAWRKLLLISICFKLFRRTKYLNSINHFYCSYFITVKIFTLKKTITMSILEASVIFACFNMGGFSFFEKIRSDQHWSFRKKGRPRQAYLKILKQQRIGSYGETWSVKKMRKSVGFHLISRENKNWNWLFFLSFWSDIIRYSFKNLGNFAKITSSGENRFC